ncbi:uncharacterized protein LOC108330317 [Vigna angularis]|uniref:uncharacterized protein LOC108330317 n=1 Tax=Phaseolus angularis TaxID=3914 RepID=UPI00080A5E01|nr:uncharacterized protein LOC108330317 [Vigna angularis]
MFNRQFVDSSTQDLTIFKLVTLKQGKEETLRAFMDRYHKTVHRVKGLSPELALQYILPTLKPGPFKDSVCRRAPKTMKELRERAANEIRVEEMKVSYKKENHESKGEKTDGGSPKCGADSRAKETTHTAKVDECVTLKDKIEELIRAGQLKKYVRIDHPHVPLDRPSPRRTSPRRPERQERSRRDRTDRPRFERWRSRSRSMSHDRPLRGHINTISGGFAGGGSSLSARKRHVRALQSVHVVDKPRRTMSPITFSDKDFHAPDPDQDDPMVITVEIAHYSVSKVLVDQGSLVNILYWKTFQQMDISDDLFVPYNEKIMGFTGERVDTRGYVDL